VERSTQRFGVPDGLLVTGLFGGALVLLGLALGTPGDTALEILAGIVTIASGALLVRRLWTADSALAEAKAEAELSATRLRVLVEHVPAAVYIDMADPDVTDGGRLAYMSPRISGILGVRPEELVDDPELWPSLIHPDDREAAIAAYATHWRTGEPLRAEYRMRTADGRFIWVRDEAYGMPDDTRSGRQVSQGLLIDITDRKDLEDRLRHDALHDPLTGLANRVLLREHLQRALASLGGSGGGLERGQVRAHQHEEVALMFVDLDDFKRVNDSYGHAVGDQILVAVAGRLAGAVRGDDVVARQSGDEFAVLLPRVGSVDEATATAERILRELRRPIPLGDQAVVICGSIGIALADEPGVPFDELMIQADGAMYAAKAGGKGSYAVYDQRMPIRTWSELEAAG
jgi:diguanylate cyclase (GGDEF)-like protein/PAS domain S-box-containing protein